MGPPLLAQIQSGKFCGAFASSPCSTFSSLRGSPGGPAALRGAIGKSRYGLSDLTAKPKEYVRLHNLLAVRSALALTAMHSVGGVFVYETPARRANNVPMLLLDEYLDLLRLPGVKHLIGLQCPFGSMSAKATSWVYHKCCFDDMPTTCPHPLRSWYSTVDNSEVWAKHPPSKGCVKYTPVPSQANHLVQRGSQFVSAALAHYPDLLNRFIAASMASGALRVQKVAMPGQSRLTKDFASEAVVFRQRLKGYADADARAEADRQAVGGLRDAQQSVSRLHRVAEFGKSLGAAIIRILCDDLVKCRA